MLHRAKVKFIRAMSYFSAHERCTISSLFHALVAAYKPLWFSSLNADLAWLDLTVYTCEVAFIDDEWHTRLTSP